MLGPLFLSATIVLCFLAFVTILCAGETKEPGILVPTLILLVLASPFGYLTYSHWDCPYQTTEYVVVVIDDIPYIKDPDLKNMGGRFEKNLHDGDIILKRQPLGWWSTHPPSYRLKECQ